MKPQNMLRKTTWFNYPYYKELGEAEFLDDVDTFVTHTSESPSHHIFEG